MASKQSEKGFQYDVRDSFIRLTIIYAPQTFHGELVNVDLYRNSLSGASCDSVRSSEDVWVLLLLVRTRLTRAATETQQYSENREINGDH